MFQDDELMNEFVIESLEHLADVEGQFLQIEAQGANVDNDLVNTVFRAIHSVKGAAGFLGLTSINALAHSLENVLNMIRNSELTPNSTIVNIMLRSADTLRNMIENIATSNTVDVSGFVADLEAIRTGALGAATESESQTATALLDPTYSNPVLAEQSLTQAECMVEAAVVADSAVSIPTHAPVASNTAAPPPAPAAVAPRQEEQPTPPSPKNASPANASPAPANAPAGKGSKAGDSSVRVNVAVLDRLMNLAGELVLSRNQLMLAVNSGCKEGLDNIAARMDQVTSDLQETIMQTRMQPVGTVFGRFPRVVRDLSAKLGKHCDLEIEGNEVEVDKTIVEAIGDPLTHLVRNSVDHGIEKPEVRKAAGKSANGIIRLRAFHQAGKVCIRIEDNGGGIDPQKIKAKAVSQSLITQEQSNSMSEMEALRLIFAPGFSTAAEVTDVSGRGVGMDVVRTNIEQLGGTVDIESKKGEGTAIHITLPLTLAIIPSMIVGCGEERFALPQSNIVELVRIPDSEQEERIGNVQGAKVLRLRGALLPLVSLNEVLGLEPPKELQRSVHVVVVETGQMRYGLLVDTLHDSEEIVVKPLGRHVKDLGYVAGATILGDGHIALIIDIMGLADQANLRSIDTKSVENADAQATELHEETERLLLFTNHPEEQFAVPMAVVSRLERVRSTEIRSVGGQNLLIYRGGTLPLLNIEDYLNAKSRLDDLKWMFVIVFSVHQREVGLIAPTLKDIRNVSMRLDSETFRQPGVAGATVIDGMTTRLLDLIEFARIVHPDWFIREPERNEPVASSLTVMLAEDSDFFRKHVTAALEEEGFRVISGKDGQDAWERLEENYSDVNIVVTDIEMPRMNGLEFCKKIKSDPRTASLPVIALTSLASEDDQLRGRAVGIDNYQVKMDKLQLLEAIRRMASWSPSNTSMQAAR